MTVEAEIRRRILQRGCITLAEFMELALFWPRGGYYMDPQNVGAMGDFYTSPHAHPAFGALLAVQLHQMWQVMGEPDPFNVVELGAGNGLLCRDLLTYAINLPGRFAPSLRYLCLDRQPNAGLERAMPPEARGLDAARIAGAAPSASLEEGRSSGMPLRDIQGCFLSNEFLDSFPVHQVTSLEGRLMEIYVTLEGGELATTLGMPSTPALADRLDCRGIQLANGQTAEISLGIERWVEQVADVLDAGFVLTIDYGHTAPELFSPKQRPRGTLTTFYRHTQTDAPLQRIGRQDMTAQVDFTTVIEAGRRVGLEPLGLITQGRFLSNLGLGPFKQRLRSLGLERRHSLANNAGMLEIARPGGLGDFKVLAQGKNVGHPPLWGFEPSEQIAALARELPIPLLKEDHLPLAEARYPHVGLEFDEWWPGGRNAS